MLHYILCASKLILSSLVVMWAYCDKSSRHLLTDTFEQTSTTGPPQMRVLLSC